MSIKIIYFTRSGTSKQIADKIAQKIKAPVISIKDGKNWNGFFGFIKAGYYSISNKDVAITLSEENINIDDELLVISPVWAGKVAPAIKTFLKNRNPDKIYLVTTSMGGGLKESYPYKSITEIIQSNKNEDEIIDSLCKQIHNSN